MLTGIPTTRAQGVELISRDTALFLGLGIVLMAIVLYAVLRHLGQVLLVLVSVLPGYLATLGLMGALGSSVSMLTSFLPLVVLVVGVCDTLHVLVHYRHRRAEGVEKDRAIVETFDELLVPCFYTSVTTAVAFASLVTTGIEVVVEFGAYTAFAVSVTYVYCMVLMPVLLGFGRTSRFDDRGLDARLLTGLVAAAIRAAERPSYRWPAFFAILCLGSAVVATDLRADAYLVDDVSPSHPMVRDIRWVEDQGFGLFQVALWLSEERSGALLEPEMLAWMDRAQRFAEREGEGVVLHSLSVLDILRQVKRAVMGSADGASDLPATRDEAAQLLLLADMGNASRLRDFHRDEDGQGQIVLLLRDAGSARTVPFLERLERFLRENPPPNARVVPTGTVVLAERVYAQFIGSFGVSLLASCVTIFVLMVVMCRSFVQGLVALVPNVVPLIVLLAIPVLGGFPVKPTTLLVFSIAFGIAVDDTIHLLSRTRFLLDQGLPVKEAVPRSLRDSGHAVVLTSVVLSLGFGILVGSAFQVLFLVGALTVASIAVALLADLFLYPWLLERTTKTPSAKPATMEADSTA